jgi:hypothetical protein
MDTLDGGQGNDTFDFSKFGSASLLCATYGLDLSPGFF